MTAVKGRRRPQPSLTALPELLKAGKLGLLGEVVRFLRTYVVMTPAQLVATALWVVHTHAVMTAEQTPYLIITSPEKQCGKTRLMETIQLIVAKPWLTVTPSEAVVYRYIDRIAPTLLLDEVDAIFNPRSADKHEGLRAIINAGNRRGAKVPRAIGTSVDIAEFSVYSAKALAGIGSLPDTVADRGLPIRLQRRATTERVKRMRRREAEPVGKTLQAQLAAWAKANAKALERARPVAPSGLSDRMQDATEPLLAIAQRMGEPWPALAREALVEVCTGERADDVGSMRLRLLADIKAVFLASERRAITTERLIAGLVAIEESPWGHYYGREFEPRDMAALLKHYGIRSENLKLQDGTVRKGYKRASLQDAWERYV